MRRRRCTSRKTTTKCCQANRWNHQFARLPESVHFRGSCSGDFDDSRPPADQGPFRCPRTLPQIINFVTSVIFIFTINVIQCMSDGHTYTCHMHTVSIWYTHGVVVGYPLGMFTAKAMPIVLSVRGACTCIEYVWVTHYSPYLYPFVPLWLPSIQHWLCFWSGHSWPGSLFQPCATLLSPPSLHIAYARLVLLWTD